MDTTTFTDLRQRLRDHLDQVRETGRPLFVTANGETEAVLLSPEAFNELAERAELAASLETLDRSMEDIREGRVRPLEDAVRDTRGMLAGETSLTDALLEERRRERERDKY